MELNDIIKKLRYLSDPEAIEGMARFGINSENTFGVSIPELRKIAREVGKNHRLAKDLWLSGIHEARILASMIDDPKKVTEKQMDNWVNDFDSWDVCDQCCNKLFDKTPFAYEKAVEWSTRNKEFVRRAGFVMMTQLAVHDKQADNRQFEQFFPLIVREASDGRNFVKKAVNWALRQIGKRNIALNRRAIEVAKEIREIDSKAATWIANNALKELTSDKIQKRLKR